MAKTASNQEPLLEKKVVEFFHESEDNPTFRSNVGLALFSGLLITLFFVPVCSSNAHAWLFAEETYFIPGTSNIYSGNVADWEASHPGKELYRVEGLNLPGVLNSPDLIGYWPNIFQFMFFSVYLDFPTTMQQVYQGVVGTFLANMNYFVMLKLISHGGECTPDVESKTFGLKPPCKEGTYASPEYGRWGYILAILDVNGGLILTFFLNLGLPVKKWCLSYSALFMMTYMSSGKTQSSHAVVLTTLLGAGLAVLALCGRRLLPAVADKPEAVKEGTWGPVAIGKQVKDIMSYSTQYFEPHRKYGDQQRRAYAMKVEELVKDMNESCDTMNTKLSASWWESFNLRKTGEKRERMKRFAKIFEFDDRFGKAGGFEEMSHMVQEAVAGYARKPTNKDDPSHLSKELWIAMHNCEKQTSATLEQIAERSVSGSENDLAKDYGELDNKRNKLVEEALNPKNANTNKHAAAMVFAVNYYASVVKKYDGELRNLDKLGWKKRTYQIIKDGILSVFWLKEVIEEGTGVSKGYAFNSEEFWDAFSWNASNAVVIGAAFWIGYWFDGGFFVGYSNYLASSLAVLLGSQGAGSSFNKNLQRLLGVVLGKAIGLLTITLVALAGCESTESFVVHLGMIFIFMSYFSYVYYEGGQWSFVCCLIVGFGCYTLGGVDVCSMWGTGVFSGDYKEVGQLTFAIVFRMAFDSVVTWWRGNFPRDEAVNEMRQLCWSFDPSSHGSPESPGSPGNIIQAFARLKGKSDDYSMLKEAKKHFTKVQDLLEDTKMDKVLSRGRRVPFNYTLLAKVVPLLQQILRELDLVFLVVTDKGGSGEARLNGGVTDFDLQEEEDLWLKLKITMQLLQKALEKKGAQRIFCQLMVKGSDGGVRQSNTAKSPAMWVINRSIKNLSHLLDEILAAVHLQGGLVVEPKEGEEGLLTEEEKEAKEDAKEDEGRRRKRTASS